MSTAVVFHELVKCSPQNFKGQQKVDKFEFCQEQKVPNPNLTIISEKKDYIDTKNSESNLKIKNVRLNNIFKF